MSHRELLPLSDAQGPFYAGIDLGGTNIKAGIVDNLGRSVAFVTAANRIEEGPEAGAERMADSARQAAAEAGLTLDQLAHVGLAAPGTMDIPAGMLLAPMNMAGWENFPIRDRVAHHLDRQVVFANDANAAAFGEYWVGSGDQFGSMVLLTLGTGIGGGIIISDLSVDGENSHGGECGHLIIDRTDDARRCGCGQRGHLEAYASATALVRRAEEAIDAGRSSTLASQVAESSTFTARDIHRAAEAGDELALELILQTAHYLSLGITTLLHAIDPAAVILGGAMDFGGRGNPIGRAFLEAIRQEVRSLAFPVLADNIHIDFATLGGDAGYIGAAGIARVAHQTSG